MDYNIVLLYYENGHPTGVIRYIEMLKRGLLTQKKYKTHSIVLDSSAIFPEIYEKKDLIFARLPFEINPCSAQVLCHLLRIIEARRTAGVFLQQIL